MKPVETTLPYLALRANSCTQTHIMCQQLFLVHEKFLEKCVLLKIFWILQGKQKFTAFKYVEN